MLELAQNPLKMDPKSEKLSQRAILIEFQKFQKFEKIHIFEFFEFS